jgi:hypothetical protein
MRRWWTDHFTAGVWDVGDIVWILYFLLLLIAEHFLLIIADERAPVSCDYLHGLCYAPYIMLREESNC